MSAPAKAPTKSRTGARAGSPASPAGVEGDIDRRKIARKRRGSPLRDWDAAGFDARRRAAGITFEELAMRGDIGSMTIRRAMRTGKAKPGTARLLRLALGALLRERRERHMFEEIDNNA